MNPNQKIHLISTKELAKILGKSTSTARELMISDGFPSVKIKGHYYVLESSLIAWLQKLEKAK